MDTDSGYETSLMLCQVEMGFEADKESTASSVNQDKSSCKESCAASNADKSSPLGKVHKCDYPGCEAKFDRPWKLSSHRCIHTGERPYKCRFEGCTKSYTNLTHVRRHEQANHVGKQAFASDGAPIPAETFICGSPGCGNTFRSKCTLKKHFIRKHQDVVKCPDCDMVFQKHVQLKTHMFTHDGIKPFKCEWCNSSFVNHNDVMSHIKKHKLYRCSYMDCPEGSDKIYTNRNELRSHLALIHPSKYSCENCNKTFTLKCRLTSHKLSCGSDKNNKQYKCIIEECSHVFKLHRNMLQHVKHKHGEPRFACQVENCGKKFIWKISYNKHVKTYHESRQIQSYQYCTESQKLSKQKKQRKDANVPKFLVAEMLSGVSVDKDTHMMLLNKQRVDIDEALMQATVGLTFNDCNENKYDSESLADVEPPNIIYIKQERTNEDTTEDSEEFCMRQIKLNSPPTQAENDCQSSMVGAVSNILQAKPNSPEHSHTERCSLPVVTESNDSIPNSSNFFCRMWLAGQNRIE